jgi:hypothetical protein
MHGCLHILENKYFFYTVNGDIRFSVKPPNLLLGYIGIGGIIRIWWKSYPEDSFLRVSYIFFENKLINKEVVNWRMEGF